MAFHLARATNQINGVQQQLSFTVFLGNLPVWVTADDIKTWLSAEDLVADSIKVIRNHETQESKGFAFVRVFAVGIGLPPISVMRLFLTGVLLAGASSISPVKGEPSQLTPVVNVNSRYVVESIEIAGQDQFTLSAGIHEQIQNLVGENLDPASLDELSERIRKEVHAKTVTYRIGRGDQPDQVKVNFEVTRRSIAFEVNVPKFLYHSTQGWTGVVEGVTGYGSSAVTFRLLSDNDEMVERNTGILARYENKRLGSDRLRLAFQFESYHQN